ncbi:MAG TPA: hypothetical protein VG225_16235 [Terracidiphilus sp.]|jgi:hypothetical protein|nr:hypothetical protein [Terracidiphilus sp.]
MKRSGWMVLVLMVAVSAWAASKKMTVAQLEDLLASQHQAGKSDADVAAELQNVELTEELTHSTMNSMSPEVPGQLTTEQLYVLEIRSAVLPAPATDISTAAAPDAAAQKAMLDKAMDYAAKTYAQLPAMSATKVTRRFQDNPQPGKDTFAAKNNATLSVQGTAIRYTASAETPVSLHGGVENAPAKEKTNWGDNGMIAMEGQPPALNAVLQEAQAAGKINWVRWEMVNGMQTAVYSFSVDKKKSHYAVSYCCFPETSQAGNIAMRGTETAGGAGNYMNNANWKNWKGTEPYHGEIFVDPKTGVVVRLDLQAELKGSDPVRVEKQRIDYGEVKVGDKAVIVPVQTLIDTLEQPYPDSPTGRFVFRHTLFAEDYKDYQAGS